MLDVSCSNATQLVQSIQTKLIPGIVAGLTDKPGAEQQNSDGTWDAIRVGNKGLILSRDWLNSELDKKRREILGVSAVIIQAAYRAMIEQKAYWIATHPDEKPPEPEPPPPPPVPFNAHGKWKKGLAAAGIAGKMSVARQHNLEMLEAKRKELEAKLAEHEKTRKVGIVDMPLMPGPALYALPRRSKDGSMKPGRECYEMFDPWTDEYIGAAALKHGGKK